MACNGNDCSDKEVLPEQKCDACFVDLINLVLHQPDDESSLECLKMGLRFQEIR